MDKDLLQDITIYHKEDNKYVRYPEVASVRNTSIRNRNNTGTNDTDTVLIRIFDTKGYNDTWKCQKGDTIVLMDVSDETIDAPLTELRNKYGKEYVCQVNSIDIFDFSDENIIELNHIKIGAK